MISSADSKEISHFKEFASDWWDEAGPYKILHELNPVRLSYIRHNLPPSFSSLKILDVGCGGGLLCEPMARLGATVTGLDATHENILAAKDHADKMSFSESILSYETGTLEKKSDQWHQTFDVLFILEILEHVTNIAFFLEHCAKVTKKGGTIFVSTLNRTFLSYFLGILTAEYILGWVPKKTHSWRKFIRPSELAAHAESVGLSLEDIQGLSYHIPSSTWALSKKVDVNYIGILRKK